MEHENNKDFTSFNTGEQQKETERPFTAQNSETYGAPSQSENANHAGGSGYANVGSSGTNSANFNSGTNFYNTQYSAQHPQQNGYGYNNYNTPNYNAATYRTGQPPLHNTSAYTEQNTSQKKGSTVSYRNFAKRAVSFVLVGTVGFAGGYMGSMFAGNSNGNVVVNKIDRSDIIGNLTTSTDGLNLTTSEVSAIVSPSVVVITTEQMVTTNNWFGEQVIQSGAGSGVIISEDGYILTCEHVVENSTNIVVTIGENEYVAEYIGGDKDSDVAVIKITGEGFTPAVLGDSDVLALGEGVVAVGNPLGELGGTVTDGIVSALDRIVVVENSAEMSLIQTNASVSPGNSGGGLFNMAGELIGIVNAKSGDSEAEGLGFAIPINHAYNLASSIITHGYIPGRPELGITAINVTDAQTAMQWGVNALGVYVYGVNPNSAAEKAGLQMGDRIISIEDKEVGVLEDVTDAIANHEVGATISMTIARDGSIMTVQVQLGEKGSTKPVEEQPTTETAPQEEQKPQQGIPDIKGFNPFG